jgi:alpha-1,2-mannosyltransferase
LFIYLAPDKIQNTMLGKNSRWNFSRRERVWFAVGICLIIAFGAVLERRTALRRVPMTDLGCFSCASEAAWSGDNFYKISEWHGWHYGYPPMLAILFLPLAEPVPKDPPALQPGEQRTETNTPWGYETDRQQKYYGLHEQNARFFCIVAVWYLFNVALIFLSAHTLACALEGRGLKNPPPERQAERRRWWLLRLLPLLICAGSLGTDLSRGQVDILMLAAIALGLYLAAKGKGFKAGLCFSFPAAIKLFPVTLLFFPVWRRRWRMFAGATAGLLMALVILPAVALGPKRTIDLYRVWFTVLASPALGHGTDTSRERELTGMTGTDNQSLLAAIHNWRYYSLPRGQRPETAAPWERHCVDVIGALMLAGMVSTFGIRRNDSCTELLIIAGLLIGLALVVNPVAHNFYYLLMLPLVAALLDQGLSQEAGRVTNWKLLLPVFVFMMIDFMTRMPAIGPVMRDLGAPLLSLIYLMWGGAMVLSRRKDSAAMHGEAAA